MDSIKEKNGIKDGKDETMELEGMGGDAEEEKSKGEVVSEDSDDSDGEHGAAEETEMTAAMMVSVVEVAEVMETAAVTVELNLRLGSQRTTLPRVQQQQQTSC